MSNKIDALEAAIAQQTKVLAELKVREAKKSAVKKEIDAILIKTGLTADELFQEEFELACKKHGRTTHEKPTREKGIDKFMMDGTTYDGRTVRRAPEFEEYMKDGSIDLVAVVNDGLLNPEWLLKQNKRVLVEHGITDRKEYMVKHYDASNT